MKKDRIKLILVCICILAAGICYVSGMFDAGGSSRTVITAEKSQQERETEELQKAPEADTPSQSGQSSKAAQGSEGMQSAAAGTEETPEAEKLFVHVCGEVISPGVYEFQSGSRIYQAVTKAGGYTAAAADDFLNMAQVLEDGMKIRIPDKETAKKLLAQEDQAGVIKDFAGAIVSGNTSGAAATDTSGKININTASKEQLMTLSGVGEAKAADIIAYREQNGPFTNIEDIMKVSGIKEAGFQKIRENITV